MNNFFFFETDRAQMKLVLFATLQSEKLSSPACVCVCARGDRLGCTIRRCSAAIYNSSTALHLYLKEQNECGQTRPKPMLGVYEYTVVKLPSTSMLCV